MSKPDGGAAFPAIVSCDDEQGHRVSINGGMSLRQWYAGKALQGLLACPTLKTRPDAIIEHITAWAFKYADAMLKEDTK